MQLGWKSVCLTLLGLFVFLCPSWAQGDGNVSGGDGAARFRTDTLQLQVYFRRNIATVEPGWRDNALRLRAFRDTLDAWMSQPDAVVRSVIVQTSASPEGNHRSNQKLSEARARGIESYLSDSLSLDAGLFRYRPIGEDWESLTEAVRKLDMPWRAEALHILEHTPEFIFKSGQIVDGRKRQLMNLRGGTVWKWLDANVFPDLRAGSGAVSCIVMRPAEPRVDTLYVMQRDTVYVAPVVPLAQPAEAEPKPKDAWPSGRKMLFAVRTNALAIPLANVGVEVPLGERWSVGADWYYPWLWRPRHGEGLDYAGRCFELLAGDLEARYWFPRKSKKPEQRLLGHSVGVYAAGGYYDFERNWTGHQGWFYNIGVDYLFAMPIFRGRMHLEFELGIGYIYSPAQPYDTFVAGDKAFRRKGVTQYTRWFGPTRAGVNLVVPIYVKKKGGER